MKWYEGGIAEAVTLSRQKGFVFVVYIEGTDDKSKQMTEVINSPEVSNILETGSFVAIKVATNSVSHQQFSEIYKQTPSPSIYFIGKSGSLLDILTEAPSVSEVVGKINNVIVKSGGAPIKITSDLLKSEAEPQAQATTSSDGIKSSASASTTAPTPAEEVKIAEEPKAAEKVKAAEEVKKIEEDANTSSLSTEEKLQLAQDIIDKKREQKKADEEEAEKRKEIERRKLGQDVQKMKRWQQDQELKQLMDERAKDQREKQEARDKVRRQIEEDKREKAARMAAAIPSQSNEPPKPVHRPLNDAHTARLQFRLPDGHSSTHDFPSNTVLQEVIDFLRANVCQNFQNFVLSTTFPRREFNSEDACLTLFELQLVPNAVVLVLPISNGAVSTNTNQGVMGMVWYLLSPILGLWGLLRGFFLKSPTSNSQPPQENKKRAVEDESTESTSRPMPKKRAGETVIRRQGNVHRLTDRDSDDDNNTWNGNSTQQM